MGSIRPTTANPDIQRGWRGQAGTWGWAMRTNAPQRGRRQWRRGTAGALRSEALVEEAAAPACVLDRNGRMLIANHALESLLGASTAGGLRGRTLPSLAYPPDEELADAAVQQVLEEGLDRCQVEARWVRVLSRELVWGRSTCRWSATAAAAPSWPSPWSATSPRSSGPTMSAASSSSCSS